MLKLRTKNVSLHITGHFYFSIRSVKMQDKPPGNNGRSALKYTDLPCSHVLFLFMNFS